MTKINNIDLQEKRKLAMSVVENIDTAVSSLWKLAMAMASLKHIAGMNGQEEDLASVSTGEEEYHSLPDTHSHSHVDNTEASGDDSFANKENIESEEIELAALISSLTLTMVCQQNKAPVMKVSKELIGKVDETETESIPISSMIGHQLPTFDSPLDMSEMPLSMAAHVLTANIEEWENLCDSHGNSSMITKNDRIETFVCKEEEDINQISTLTNGKQIKPHFTESEVSTNSPEENLTLYEASMCTHKVPSLETPLPLSDYQVSMVAHHQAVTENNVDSSSLVCHQAQTHHNVQQHQRESNKMSEIETIPTKQKVDSAFSTTLLAHQVSPDDTYLESSEFPISMVAHMIISTGDEETFHQANENVSMVVHQIVNEVTSATEIDKSNETVEDLCDYIRTEDEENCTIKVSKFFSSFCSHQLSPIETPFENPEYPVSFSVHTVDNHSEEEKTLDLSLSSHKLPFRACSSEFASPNYVPSMVSYQNISYVDDNTNSLVSLADHMADSLRKERNEASPKNEEKVKSHYEGIRPEGEEEGRIHVVEDIAQNIQKDHHTRLPKIEEIQRTVEVEIEEFKIKRKNNRRISKNNVQTTETHIVNNFKGVEFKSSIIIHQQLDEKCSTEDPDDKSVSSGDESIQSMVTTTEHINHLNVFEDLSSEKGSENLIAASCTIEDNSPIVITTRNQQRDETEKIESRKIDKLKSNHQAYENKSGQNLVTKNQEEGNKNTEINNKKMIILKTLSSEAKTKEKSMKKEKSQKSSTQIASFNTNSGKQTYKIRFKVKTNEDPSKSSVLNYLIGYFGGQQ